MASKSTTKILSFAFLGLVTTYLLVGQKAYGPVSKSAFDFAGAIYSTCNRQDIHRLPGVAELIRSARSASQITSDEADTLQGIIAIAESGDWTAATLEARKLMQDQVRYP